MKEINVNQGKSKCCKAKIEVSGGGYDGEDIIEIKMWCSKCGAKNPKPILAVGRPAKIPF